MDAVPLTRSPFRRSGSTKFTSTLGRFRRFAIVPGMVIPLLADWAATALGVGLFAAVLTAAAYGVLAATTTGEPQPEPVPVPLRREDG